MSALESQSKGVDLTYSLGILVNKESQLVDVIPGSPAYEAGLGPGMKLLAVNHRKWSSELLKQALRAAQASRQPIELIVQNSEFFKTYTIPYFEGEKIPHLEKIGGQPDFLSDILKSKTASAPKP